MSRLLSKLVLITSFLLLSCEYNPFGEGEVEADSKLVEVPVEDPADEVAPTAPGNLVLSGFGTLNATPVLTWTPSTDETGVTAYEISLGTSSGGQELLAFTDIGNLNTYQITALAPALSASMTYFISLRARDLAGNISDVSTSSSWSIALTQTTGAYHYPGDTYAVNCLEYLDSGYYDAEGDGLYWLDPDGAGGNTQLQAHCDMTMDGGGWTLVANRRGGSVNVEACGASLNAFLQDTCGSVASIGYSDSYSIGDTDVRTDILANNEFLFLDFDNMGTPDSDDAYIIHHSMDLFPDSINALNRFAVTQVCDFNNANCDTTGVEFLWTGNGFFSSSTCNGANNTAYAGNYGYCPNGVNASPSNGLFGNRSGYAETKLWNYGGATSQVFQQQIFIR